MQRVDVFLAELSKEVQRLKNIAIKPRWAADEGARIIAVERIATYGLAAIPVLLEISDTADSYLAKHCALECLLKLRNIEADSNSGEESILRA